jgi:hypothetical protein
VPNYVLVCVDHVSNYVLVCVNHIPNYVLVCEMFLLSICNFFNILKSLGWRLGDNGLGSDVPQTRHE